MDRLLDRQPDRVPDPGCAYPGNPGRPTAAMKRAMIEAKARELAEGAFDRLPAGDRVHLLQAADLILRPRRKGEDPVRKANSISRLLKRGLRSVSPRPTPFHEEAVSPSLSDLMSGHR